MSERKNNKKRVLLYILAALIIAAIAWVIFGGTDVFNYIDRANELRQEQSEDVGE